MVAKLKVDQLETVDGTGIITANNQLTAPSFAGDGSSLTALDATALTGNLPAIDGSSLTGVGGDLSFGGDTFGADKTIGSNDNYALSFETDGTERLQLTNDGRGLSQFTAKAWCNFNDVCTIKDSYNISSITDNTTGDWTANYTVTFAPTYEHCVLATTGGVNDSGRNDSFAVVFQNLTSGCRVRVFDISSGLSDIGSISVLAFSS